jgi:hypothetical protein
MSNARQLSLEESRRQQQVVDFIHQRERKPEMPDARQRFMRLLESMAKSSRSNERTSKQEPFED